MRELILVRHAETTESVEGRYVGWRDSPLSPHGRVRAAGLGSRLPAGALVYSSDLARALETARLALPSSPVRPDARLRELNFGGFDGYTYEENVAAHGPLFLDWLGDPYGVRPPGGELLGELETRVGEWLDALPREGRVIVFAHAGSMHALLGRIRKERFDRARATRFAYCEIVSVSLSGLSGEKA